MGLNVLSYNDAAKSSMHIYIHMSIRLYTTYAYVDWGATIKLYSLLRIVYAYHPESLLGIEMLRIFKLA